MSNAANFERHKVCATSLIYEKTALIPSHPLPSKSNEVSVSFVWSRIFPSFFLSPRRPYEVAMKFRIALSFLLLVIALIFALPPLCYSQSTNRPSIFPENVFDPPRFMPAGCSVARITQVNLVSGTKDYRSMNHDIEALNLGHTASQQVLAALATSKDTQLTDMQKAIRTMSGLTDAQNTYLCAAFLLGGEDADDENRKAAKGMLISVYNRMALGVWQLQNQLKTAAQDTASPQGTSDLKFAEAVATLLDDRKEAGSDLVNATTLAAMITIYTGDPQATKTDTVNVSCGERQVILGKLLPLAKARAVDEFTKNAGLLETFFQKHKCREVIPEAGQ